jgi:hypothetical protein
VTSPEQDHQPGDDEVLIDGEARNHRILVSRNVRAGVEAEEQNETGDWSRSTSQRREPPDDRGRHR